MIELIQSVSTKRFVLVREKRSDCREAFTFEYESKEKAEMAFSLAQENAEKETGFFMFMGRSFVVSETIWYGIYSLEEWFEGEKLRSKKNTKVFGKETQG